MLMKKFFGKINHSLGRCNKISAACCKSSFLNFLLKMHHEQGEGPLIV